MLLINQAINMFWQAILEYGVFFSLIIILILGAWVLWMAVGQGKAWQVKKSVIFSAVIAALGFFIMPKIIHSGLGEMNYWVDWAFHLATVLALFIYSYLVLLPLLTAVTSSSTAYNC